MFTTTHTVNSPNICDNDHVCMHVISGAPTTYLARPSLASLCAHALNAVADDDGGQLRIEAYGTFSVTSWNTWKSFSHSLWQVPETSCTIFGDRPICLLKVKIVWSCGLAYTNWHPIYVLGIFALQPSSACSLKECCPCLQLYEACNIAACLVLMPWVWCACYAVLLGSTADSNMHMQKIPVWSISA